MITQIELKTRVRYDKESGEFYWIKSGFNKDFLVGSKIKNKSTQGYLRAKIDGKIYYLHKLVFLYEFGYIPENPIDHIDGDKSNNKLLNLREVSVSCNRINAKDNSNSLTGVKGVIYLTDKRLFRANIMSKYLGYFKTLEEAVFTRAAAEDCLGYNLCNYSSAKKYINRVLKGGSIDEDNRD